MKKGKGKAEEEGKEEETMEAWRRAEEKPKINKGSRRVSKVHDRMGRCGFGAIVA